EVVVCERATLRYIVGQQAEIEWVDGRVETIALGPFDGLEENHLEYYRYLCGELPRPATTLIDSRPFVILNDLAYVSSGYISTISRDRVTEVRDEQDQKDYLDVKGLQAAQENFTLRGKWPGEHGWDRPLGAWVTVADLSRFHGIIREMCGAR
ncbi:MAG TPA: gfo/Idh/MocA family oxidoreductase, partial [Opitutus sp.]|nr:gfo/Idh/MocA family oxidoreductase [Opitutus sp.]